VIDWTTFLSVFAALVAYSLVKSVVRWVRGKRQRRASRYKEVVDWWLDQQTAVLVEHGLGESEAIEQAATDLSRHRIQARVEELFRNVWEMASIVVGVTGLFSAYVFILSQDLDEVIQFLDRVVSARGLDFFLLVLVIAALNTAFNWRGAVVAYLDRFKVTT